MRKSIWNAIERKLDDYSLRKKFYIFYVLCVMLPLIVTDAVVLSKMCIRDRDMYYRE